MGLRKAINLLVDVVNDPNYRELAKGLKEKIENELDKNEERLNSRGFN